jgi:hypothetical protein
VVVAGQVADESLEGVEPEPSGLDRALELGPVDDLENAMGDLLQDVRFPAGPRRHYDLLKVRGTVEVAQQGLDVDPVGLIPFLQRVEDAFDPGRRYPPSVGRSKSAR